MATAQCFNPNDSSLAVQLRALVQQAQEGDTAALPLIREVLDAHPEIWHHLGDLTGMVEHAWFSFLTGDNAAAVESMKRTVAEMKADLAGPHPTRLESLLVDQVVVTWLEVRHMESLMTQSTEMNLKQDAGELKRLESAQRRYTAALKTLAEVRTLMPNGLAPRKSVRLFEPKASTA